jgi:hypothetical protein
MNLTENNNEKVCKPLKTSLKRGLGEMGIKKE